MTQNTSLTCHSSVQSLLFVSKYSPEIALISRSRSETALIMFPRCQDDVIGQKYTPAAAQRRLLSRKGFAQLFKIDRLPIAIAFL
jgi:hypothetical protein